MIKNNDWNFHGNLALKFDIKLGGTNQTMRNSKSIEGSNLINLAETMKHCCDVSLPFPGPANSGKSVASKVVPVNKTLG